jgi:hypothetical protein
MALAMIYPEREKGGRGKMLPKPVIGDSRRVRPDARDISAEAAALGVSLIEAAAWS